MLHEGSVDLARIAVRSGEQVGTIWALGQSKDLNANLVRFPAGRGVEEHVNDEVDVILVGVSGTGAVAVDGEEHVLRAGTLVLVPKGARRRIRSLSRGFAYLSVHRRRGALRIGRKEKQSKE